MELLKRKSDCVGCSACSNICPMGCITMKEDEEGFLYPLIDKEKCIDCGICKKSCPQNISNSKKSIKIARAVINKNENILCESSSGGAFHTLVLQVINKGGVVFGAGFDEKFFVRHLTVDDLDDIKKLMGSKYTQSDIGECYKKVKKYLDASIFVLFSGTPCQVAGLHAFLKKDYENLITVDIICHGVPSPLVWKKYIDEKKDEKKSSIKKINFRSKEKGWGNYSLKMEFENGEILCETSSQNLFLLAFAQNLTLRPSCYECRYKEKRYSDLTIADFWGIKSSHPEMYNNKGVSLVITQTEKGEEFIKKALDFWDFIETDFEKAISYNKSYVEPAIRNIRRKWFFNNILKSGASDSLKKYIAHSLVWRVEIKIRKLISKI